jgi:DNA-binding NarL/FixJ family response regulator
MNKNTCVNAGSAKRHRILVVDDHPIVRSGLSQLINQEPDLRVCGEAARAEEALNAIAATKPDLVLLDIAIEGANGIDLTRTIRERDPELPVLILSMHDECLYAERAMRAGARGYVMKQEAPEIVLQAIRRVLGGDLFIKEDVAAAMLRKFVDDGHQQNRKPGVERLSNRGLEIFELIGQGLTTRDVAAKLHLSIKTVESHRAIIKSRLGIDTAAELVRQAVYWVESEGRRTAPRRA